MSLDGLTIPTRSHEAPPAVGVDTLEHALEMELRLLSELHALLQEWSAAMAQNDLAAVDENVIAAHRVMRTLEEARWNRRVIVGFLAPAEDSPLEELDVALGPRMTPALIELRARLRDEVRNVSRELAISLPFPGLATFLTSGGAGGVTIS